MLSDRLLFQLAIEKAQEASLREAERAETEVKYQQLNNSHVFTEEVLNNVLRPEQHDHNHLLNTTFINEARSRSSAAEGDSNGLNEARVKVEGNGTSCYSRGNTNGHRPSSPVHLAPEDVFLAPFASTTPRKEKSRRLTRTTTELLNETAGNPCVRYFLMLTASCRNQTIFVIVSMGRDACRDDPMTQSLMNPASLVSDLHRAPSAPSLK